MMNFMQKKAYDIINVKLDNIIDYKTYIIYNCIYTSKKFLIKVYIFMINIKFQYWILKKMMKIFLV